MILKTASIDKSMTPLEIIKREKIVAVKQEICPHCKDEIREKSTFMTDIPETDENFFMTHAACGGILKLKKLSPEEFSNIFAKDDKKDKKPEKFTSNGFPIPENPSKDSEYDKFEIWYGMNDWENYTTFVWIVDKNKEDRVWFEVNWDKMECHPSDECGNENSKEMESWADKSVSTWIKQVKEMKKDQDRSVSVELWKDALMSKEMDKYVKKWGRQSSVWKDRDF